MVKVLVPLANGCEDKVITSRGSATTIKFALTLIEKLVGEKKKKEVATALLWKLNAI